MIHTAIAIIIFFLIIPILVIISLIIFINDGLPIVYIQKNYGKNHRVFNLYKFRTMKKNTPEMPTEEFNNASSYVIRSGHFLRKYSLDELPQIINIIKGEMNFIGPRPCMVNNEEIIKTLREKCNVDRLKPGITGWAQVNGRDLNSYEKKVELDEYYMLNKNFLLNLKIIIKTIKVVLMSKGIKH